MKRSKLVFFLISIAILAACKAERDPCLQPKQVNVQMGFLQKPDTGILLKDTLLPKLNFAAVDGDTLRFLYYGAANVGRIAFPLSNLSDTVAYLLQPDSSAQLRDTLSLIYRRKLHFISNACGYTYYYDLQSIQWSKNLIDSVFIRHTEVTNDVNKRHIEVVF